LPCEAESDFLFSRFHRILFHIGRLDADGAKSGCILRIFEECHSRYRRVRGFHSRAA